jgi:hypothetical protein
MSDILPGGWPEAEFVDRQQWLRGYRCDDEYVFAPGDRFAFRG